MLLDLYFLNNTNLRYWDGTMWRSGIIKMWDGNEWITPNLQIWDGNNWFTNNG